jgi:hypothetical protein
LKRFHYLFPILIVVFGVIWITRKGNRVSTLEEKIAALETRLKTAPASSSPSSPAWMIDVNGPPKPGDWARIVRDLNERHGTLRGISFAFIDQSNLLTEEELIVGLDEIETLDLHPDLRSALRKVLFIRLTPKNPKAALLRCDLFSSREVGLANNAFKAWLEKDPAGALAWYERMQKEGALDSKALKGGNPTSDHLEIAVLNHLIDHGDASAAKRFQELPSPLQVQIISKINLRHTDEAGQIKWASFLRESLPEEGSAAAIARLTAMVGETTTDRFIHIERFLNTVEATPRERELAIDTVMGVRSFQGTATIIEFTGDFHRWVGDQAPGTADIATARLLLRLQNNQLLTYDEILTQVEQFHAQGSGDDLIANTFAKRKDDLTPEQSARTRALISRIQDKSRRDPLLNRFAK